MLSPQVTLSAMTELFAGRQATGWCWQRAVAAPGSRALGRFGATADGNIRAPCMIRGVRAAKRAPSWQDLRAVYPPTAVCGAFRMHGAYILPKPAHFGCMACESCHELAIFPSEAAFGMHGAQNLPRIAARERTRAQSYHRQAPGNAFHGHFAISERPQRRSARHHAPRHHAPQRHNAMLYGAMLHNAPRCNTMMPCAVRGAFVAAEK